METSDEELWVIFPNPHRHTMAAGSWPYVMTFTDFARMNPTMKSMDQYSFRLLLPRRPCLCPWRAPQWSETDVFVGIGSLPRDQQEQLYLASVRRFPANWRLVPERWRRNSAFTERAIALQPLVRLFTTDDTNTTK